MVLAHTTSKDDDIYAAQSCSVCTDILLDAVEVHLLSQDGTGITSGSSRLQIAHVARLTKYAQHATLLVEQVGDTGRVQSLLIHNIRDSTTVNVTTTGTHHKTFQRSKTHAGILTLTVLNC